MCRVEVSQQDTISDDHSHSAPDAATVFTILSEVFKQQPPDTVITEKVQSDYFQD
jgi:hypothetical protein